MPAHLRLFISSLLLLSCLPHSAVAAPEKPSAPPPAVSATGLSGVSPLDGVNIEAVEVYQNPKSQQFDFGLVLLPIDPYYNGFAVNLGYRRYFGKTWSWEVLDASYIYSVEKDLTSQLAQNYGVAPQSIERLTFTVASNLEYVHAYGKFVFLKKYIRYFRSAFVFGPAYVTSNKRGTVGADLGWRFETFVNSDFSWVFQIRDLYAPSNISNNLELMLGTAYAF